MTLLSNTFLAVPSTAEAITVDGSDGDSPSTSNVDGPSPSQVLSMTIKKKRRILRHKDRDLRVELLLTSTIRRLCQEIGDHLRTKRLASAKRRSTTTISNGSQDDDSTTPTVRHHTSNNTKRSRIEETRQEVGPIQVSQTFSEQPNSVASVGTLVLDDQKREEISKEDGQLRKRKMECEDSDQEKKSQEETFDERDPFGLDDFFKSMRTCRVGGSNR